MIVNDSKKVEAVMSVGDGIKGASMKKLVGPDEGWDSHVMREVNLEPFGYSPRHAHDWPHINYVLKGKGTLEIDGVLNEIEAGYYAYVPANKVHQFTNKTDGEMAFICIVPKEGHL